MRQKFLALVFIKELMGGYSSKPPPPHIESAVRTALLPRLKEFAGQAKGKSWSEASEIMFAMSGDKDRVFGRRFYVLLVECLRFWGEKALPSANGGPSEFGLAWNSLKGQVPTPLRDYFIDARLGQLDERDQLFERNELRGAGLTSISSLPLNSPIETNKQEKNTNFGKIASPIGGTLGNQNEYFASPVSIPGGNQNGNYASLRGNTTTTQPVVTVPPGPTTLGSKGDLPGTFPVNYGPFIRASIWGGQGGSSGGPTQGGAANPVLIPETRSMISKAGSLRLPGVEGLRRSEESFRTAIIKPEGPPSIEKLDRAWRKNPEILAMIQAQSRYSPEQILALKSTISTVDSLIIERRLLLQQLFTRNFVRDDFEDSKNRFEKVCLSGYKKIEGLVDFDSPLLELQKERAVREIELSNSLLKLLAQKVEILNDLPPLRKSALQALDRHLGEHPPALEGLVEGQGQLLFKNQAEFERFKKDQEGSDALRIPLKRSSSLGQNMFGNTNKAPDTSSDSKGFNNTSTTVPQSNPLSIENPYSVNFRPPNASPYQAPSPSASQRLSPSTPQPLNHSPYQAPSPPTYRPTNPSTPQSLSASPSQTPNPPTPPPFRSNSFHEYLPIEPQPVFPPANPFAKKTPYIPSEVPSPNLPFSSQNFPNIRTTFSIPANPLLSQNENPNTNSPKPSPKTREFVSRNQSYFEGHRPGVPLADNLSESKLVEINRALRSEAQQLKSRIGALARRNFSLCPAKASLPDLAYRFQVQSGDYDSLRRDFQTQIRKFGEKVAEKCQKSFGNRDFLSEY